ncbi:MAG: hypothetical protein ACE3L7_14475 [Candidatus Pristimantibacillus sp.]
MKNKVFKKTFLSYFSLFSVTSLMTATGAYATPLGNLADNLNSDFTKWIPVILLIVAIYMIAKRDWFKMIGFIAAAILMSIFTNWTFVKQIGTTVFNFFF